jgi:pimeloyl-ACP methyl ester carboxylesterase
MASVDRQRPPPPEGHAAGTAALHSVGAAAQLWAVRATFRTVGALAPALAAPWAEALFCRPPRHQPRAGDLEFLAAGRRSTVEDGNETLAVWEWGRGPTVLLVHGWGSRAGRFSALGPALVAAGYRVVAHDGPAHGASSGRRASMPQFAAAIRRVAAAKAAGGIHAVVGHSLGGAAAILAMTQGLRVDRAVLLAAPADVEVFSHRFARFLRIPDRTRLRMQRNLEARFRLRWDDIHLARLVRRVTAAGLVVHDAEDADVPVREGEAIAAAWPGAELVRTHGLGHRGVLRDPGVIQRVVSFVASG